MRGISFGSLLLIFIIVVVLFGTRRLREVGGDLGAAVRSFKRAMQEEVVEEKKKEE
jgi:sec-independent protein translocase protein TatA